MQLCAGPCIRVRGSRAHGSRGVMRQQAPAGSPGHLAGSAGCVRVLVHLHCQVQQAQAGSLGAGSSSGACKVCTRQASSLLVCMSHWSSELAGLGRIRADRCFMLQTFSVPKHDTSPQLTAWSAGRYYDRSPLDIMLAAPIPTFTFHNLAALGSCRLMVS